jgi:hypothetical protein
MPAADMQQDALSHFMPPQRQVSKLPKLSHNTAQHCMEEPFAEPRGSTSKRAESLKPTAHRIAPSFQLSDQDHSPSIPVPDNPWGGAPSEHSYLPGVGEGSHTNWVRQASHSATSQGSQGTHDYERCGVISCAVHEAVPPSTRNVQRSRHHTVQQARDHKELVITRAVG